MQAILNILTAKAAHLDRPTAELIATRLLDIANRCDRDETEQQLAKWFADLATR